MTSAQSRRPSLPEGATLSAEAPTQQHKSANDRDSKAEPDEENDLFLKILRVQQRLHARLHVRKSAGGLVRRRGVALKQQWWRRRK